MSGICGILRLDGAPAEGLEAMTALLGRRGPDATRAWRDGPVALGHTLLATTPEALHEKMPLAHEGTGCTVTADVRLDNREELMAALGLSPRGRVIGDGELILRAYLAWGEACPERLLGDFAFAIWDPRGRRLFAARDQMGMRRLAYAHVPGRVLAFATEPRAARAAPDVPRDLDEGRVADFIVRDLQEVDFESTMYRSVRQVPPAHLLVAGRAGVTVRRYWSLTPGPPLELGSDKAYAQAFLDVFTEAVRCRLRNAGGLGAMLSGGMDSGATVAVASRLLAAEGLGPLPTVSVTGPAPEARPEAEGIRASLSIPGLRPHLADIGDPAAWVPAFHDALRSLEEPFDGHTTVARLAYLTAQKAGLRVVLDGLAGDTVLTQGHRMPWLVRSGRLVEFLAEAVAIQREWGLPGAGWGEAGKALRLALVPDRLRRLRRRWWPAREPEPSWPLLSPAFAREVDLAARLERCRRNNAVPFLPPPLDRAAAITAPLLTVGRESWDRVASGHGIEPRDPFLDLRVIRFCLGCPTGQMSRRAWPKLVLRHAMEGLLPPEVIWRSGRHHFGPSLTRTLRAAPGLVPPEGPALGPENAAFLQRATGLTYGQALNNPLTNEDRWSYLILALWLQAEAGTGQAGLARRG